MYRWGGISGYSSVMTDLILEGLRGGKGGGGYTPTRPSEVKEGRYELAVRVT